MKNEKLVGLIIYDYKNCTSSDPLKANYYAFLMSLLTENDTNTCLRCFFGGEMFKLSEDDKREILNLKKLGKTWKEIADKYNISSVSLSNSMSYYIKKHDKAFFDTLKRKTVFISDDVIKNVLQRNSNGESFKSIANDLKINLSTLKNKIRKYREALNDCL